MSAQTKKVIHRLVIYFTNSQEKSQNVVTDLNNINFVDVFYSLIFRRSLNKICRLFPNYTVNYQNPYFISLLHEIRSFFRSGEIFVKKLLKELK